MKLQLSLLILSFSQLAFCLSPVPVLRGVGENCGGFTPSLEECEPGLTCFFQPQEGPVVVADAQGVCVAITTSTVEPTQTTSTVSPTQPASGEYPTDVVVGAASGITAFSFAGMIALFL